jgi:hypothetical protein
LSGHPLGSFATLYQTSGNDRQQTTTFNAVNEGMLEQANNIETGPVRHGGTAAEQYVPLIF